MAEGAAFPLPSVEEGHGKMGPGPIFPLSFGCTCIWLYMYLAVHVFGCTCIMNLVSRGRALDLILCVVGWPLGRLGLIFDGLGDMLDFLVFP